MLIDDFNPWRYCTFRIYFYLLFSRHRCKSEPILSISPSGAIIDGSIDLVIEAVENGNDIHILEDNRLISVADNVHFDSGKTMVEAMVIWRLRNENREEDLAFNVVAFTVSGSQVDNHLGRDVRKPVFGVSD